MERNPYWDNWCVVTPTIQSELFLYVKVSTLREASLEATYSPKVVGLGCNNLNFLCPFRIRKKVKKELCLYNAAGSLEPWRHLKMKQNVIWLSLNPPFKPSLSLSVCSYFGLFTRVPRETECVAAHFFDDVVNIVARFAVDIKCPLIWVGLLVVPVLPVCEFRCRIFLVAEHQVDDWLNVTKGSLFFKIGFHLDSLLARGSQKAWYKTHLDCLQFTCLWFGFKS